MDPVSALCVVSVYLLAIAGPHLLTWGDGMLVCWFRTEIVQPLESVDFVDPTNVINWLAMLPSFV